MMTYDYLKRTFLFFLLVTNNIAWGSQGFPEDLSQVLVNGKGEEPTLYNGVEMAGANHVVLGVTGFGTPKKLESFMKGAPCYRVHYGSYRGETLMSLAFRAGNKPLIKKLWEIDPRVVDGNCGLGCTILPAILEAAYLPPALSLSMTSLLCDLGAKINLVSKFQGISETALFASSKDSQKKDLTKYLLCRGAVIYTDKPLPESQMRNLREALGELKEERIGLQLFSKGLLHSKRTGHTADFCQDIANIIISYLYDVERLDKKKAF